MLGTGIGEARSVVEREVGVVRKFCKVLISALDWTPGELGLRHGNGARAAPPGWNPMSSATLPAGGDHCP